MDVICGIIKNGISLFTQNNNDVVHNSISYVYSSSGSVVDSCVLGDGSHKVVSSSPGEDTWTNYFHFICFFSYIGLLNNI